MNQHANEEVDRTSTNDQPNVIPTTYENGEQFSDFVHKSLFCMTKQFKLRYYCLLMVTNPYPF